MSICALGTLPLALTAATRVAAAAGPSTGGVEFLGALRGASGKLVAAFRTPGEPLVPDPPPGVAALYEPRWGAPVVSPRFAAPPQPGVYAIAVGLGAARQPVEDLRLITLVPFSAKKQGQIGAYHLGQWPFESGGAPSESYANPAGFVEVSADDVHLQVSKHFRLGDFLTKDQPTVWPKYLLLDAALLDKLELVIDELDRAGHRVTHMAVMSGFRTPRYNRSGGTTSGRASLSRHLYGDATDIFVDNDLDGWTDDVTGDGRVDVHDAEVVAAAAERAEARHPELVGGVGIYPATRAHGPFTHVDVRGRRARWRGGTS